MPDLTNICKVCNIQFLLRDDFLNHITKKHNVSEEKWRDITNEFS